MNSGCCSKYSLIKHVSTSHYLIYYKLCAHSNIFLKVLHFYDFSCFTVYALRWKYLIQFKIKFLYSRILWLLVSFFTLRNDNMLICAVKTMLWYHSRVYITVRLAIIGSFEEYLLACYRGQYFNLVIGYKHGGKPFAVSLNAKIFSIYLRPGVWDP